MNFLRNRRSVVLLGTKNWRLRTGRSKNASAKSRSSAEITSPELPDPDAAKPRNSSAGTSLRERVLGLSSAAASNGDSELATDNQSVDRASAPRVDGDASHSTGLRATAVQAASIDDAGFNSDPDAILKRPSSGVDDLASMNKKAANPSSSEPDKEALAANASAEGGSASVKKSAVAHLDIKVPKSIDKYTIGGRLGSGTCGVVHKALDEVLGREVAIKLSPVGEPVATNGKVPGAQRAYQTEVFAAGRLRHPNVITVYDAGQHDDLNYFVMEAIDGVSLKHYGKGQKLLPVYRALEIICDCCMALDYIHRQDILHRDIKPANIMVARDGTVKLLDFGIAVGLSESSGLSQRGPTLGTPNYMSPEQILGKELGPASDFYSLGTVLFELLTGKQLFKAKKVKDLFKT
ncbi:MAG: serine/threonine protein kinase, partial [Gammaproteobacteria bacterium]|nr:serine/threonine protein kinase [Gammaproteobacteria bacterium]